MKYSYILSIFIFMSSCHSPSVKSHQVPNYEKIADRITSKIAQKIEAETGLSLAGIGGGMMDHVRMMAMSFDCYKEITVEQGRELLIYCVNEYLSAINANEEIRPYLVHYPFTPRDVEIAIFIFKDNRRSVPDGVLSVICAAGGELRYRVRKSNPIRLELIHEETYEKAIQILKNKDPIDKVRKNRPLTLRV